MKIESLFDCKTYKFKPKHSLKYIQQFKNSRKFNNNFEMIRCSTEKLDFLHQKNYVLQFLINRSVETYVFTIYNDDDGYYLADNKSLLKFHDYKNAIKYKFGNIYKNNYMSYERMDYFCYETSYHIKSTETLTDFINASYSKGKRIYV